MLSTLSNTSPNLGLVTHEESMAWNYYELWDIVQAAQVVLCQQMFQIYEGIHIQFGHLARVGILGHLQCLGIVTCAAIRKCWRMSRLAAWIEPGRIDNKVIWGVLGTNVLITLQYNYNIEAQNLLIRGQSAQTWSIVRSRPLPTLTGD